MSQSGTPSPIDSNNNQSDSLLSWFISELMSPVNAVLTLICAYLAYRILAGNKEEEVGQVTEPVLPAPLPKHDMTLEELKKYDGTGPDGRICLSVNRKVFDVTKGRRHYGKDGPYGNFAGRDATRALGSFDINAVKETWDDYSDISSANMASAKEWEEQLSERYDFVGYLVKDANEENQTEESKEELKKDD